MPSARVRQPSRRETMAGRGCSAGELASAPILAARRTTHGPLGNQFALRQQTWALGARRGPAYMTNLAFNRAFEEDVIRKPPASAQYNWITGGVDVAPEQMELPLPPVDDAVLPDDGSVVLLATENGSQLFVSGFGLFIGKKSERVVVRQGKSVVAQVPLMRLQEIIVASRGVSFSSDLIQELCERGIRMACLTSGGKPFALIDRKSTRLNSSHLV